MSTDDMSAADLVRELRAYGLTKVEIARELGRSPRMVTKIERGDVPGTMYVGALRQLHDTGRSIPPVPRRRGRGGDLMKVRGRGGETIAPTDPTVTPRRYRKRDTVYLGQGGRRERYEVPKGRNTKGRAEATQEFLHDNGRRAMGRRRVKFMLTYANGRTLEGGSKGGYRARDVQRAIRGKHGGDVFAWIASQTGHRYDDLLDGDVPVVEIEAIYTA